MKPQPVPPAVHDAAMEAYSAGLAAVDPTVLVRKAVRQGFLDDWILPPGTKREKPLHLHVLALGKAAPRMLWGLVEGGVMFSGIGAAPPGVLAPNVDTFTWHLGNHPVPDANSFAAGQAILDWVAKLPHDAPVLVLLSGGASACAEVPSGISPEELRKQWRTLLHAGLTIEAMNAKRTQMSALKGGKLGSLLLQRTNRVRVWMIADSDPATAAATVGSAPFLQADSSAIPHRVLASNGDAVAAAGLRLAALGFNVFRHARRVADDVAGDVHAFLSAANGLPAGQAALVGGGEALVQIPVKAPPGGRCQHAAVVAAQWLHDHKSPLAFIAVATDGIDGTTDAAGALVTGADGGAGCEDALRHFSAHQYLETRARLVHMGATGTNVNDLWVALRPIAGPTRTT